MSWTYSGDPSSSDRDELRFKIGDTDPKNPELQDEELNYIITQVSAGGSFNCLKAAMIALRAILAKYKSLVDEKVGDVDVKWSQRYRKVADLLDEYTQQHAKSALGSAYAGGISISDKENQEQDPDRVIPAITKDFGVNKRQTGSGIPRSISGIYSG